MYIPGLQILFLSVIYVSTLCVAICLICLFVPKGDEVMQGQLSVYRNVYSTIHITLTFCDITGFGWLCIVPFAAGLPPKSFGGNPV